MELPRGSRAPACTMPALLVGPFRVGENSLTAFAQTGSPTFPPWADPHTITAGARWLRSPRGNSMP